MKQKFATLSLAFLLANSGAALLTPVAFASGGGEASSDSASNKILDMSGLTIPVTNQDGKLVNYLFVSVQVEVGAGYDHWEVRESAHRYRDLVLKAAHKTPVGDKNHPMRLDEEAFKALLHRVFDEALGPDSIAHIEIIGSDSQKIFLDG